MLACLCGSRPSGTTWRRPAEAVRAVGVGGRGAGFWGGVVALVVPRFVLGTTEHVLHPLGENQKKLTT